MSSITLLVHHKPLRIGFLIEDKETEQLVEAVRLNTALWGGMYNPIIPVGEDPNLTDSLIKLFRVDVLHPINDSSAIRKVFDKYTHLSWPHPYKTPGLIEYSNGKKMLTAADVLSVVRKEDNFRYFLPDWKTRDSICNLLTVLFGQYPQSFECNYGTEYKHKVDAQRSVLGIGKNIPKRWLNKIGPLEFTVSGLLVNVDFLNEIGVYVGKASDFGDLMSFWNLRASGMHILFWDPTLVRLKNFVLTWLTNLWSRAQSSDNYYKHIALWAKKRNTLDELQDELKDIIPKGTKTLICTIDNTTWNGYNVKPASYSTEFTNVLGDLDKKSDDDLSVSLLLPHLQIPDDKDQNTKCQRHVVGISPLHEYEYKGFTLIPPFVPELNKWFCNRMVSLFTNKLRVSVHGLGLIEPIGIGSITKIRLLRNIDIIQQLFKHSGIGAEPSLSGRITEHLIQQVGGIEGCNVFKIPGVRKLVKSREARKGITKKRAVDIIQNRGSFKAFQHLYIEPRKTKQLLPANILNYLLEKGLMRSGIHLSCPNCTIEFWLPIHSLDNSVKCEYCGFSFPIGPQLKDKGDWKFRLSGLFGRGFDILRIKKEWLLEKLKEQLPIGSTTTKNGLTLASAYLHEALMRTDYTEGAVPVALTLLLLFKKLSSIESFLYSTALQLSWNDIDCEIDLVLIERRRREGYNMPNIVIGECKGYNEINNNDIDNMLKVRSALEKVGYRCYLLFSKASQEFTQSEIDRFKMKLHSKKIEFILFTINNLQPDDPYLNPICKFKVQHSNARTFSEMAINSIKLYLE